MLGIADIAADIVAIDGGEPTEENFAVVGNDWHVEQRALAILAASAATVPQALRAEITTLATRAQVRGWEPALRAFAAQLADPAADRLVASLILRVRAGGRGLVDVLDGLARSLREEVAVRRHAEADRAKPRANMRSLVIITVVVAAALALFAREYLTPLDTPVGQLVLATVLGIFAVGFVWMHRLTRPRQTGLFLAKGDELTKTDLLAVTSPGSGL